VTPEEIRTGLSDPDVEVRRRAVLALDGATDDEAPRLVLEALGDTEWRVRKEAARIAAQLSRTHSLVDELTSAVSQGENIGLRSAAIEVLGLLGPGVADRLVAALDTVPEAGRKFLVAALGEVGGDAALPALAAAAKSDDVNLVAAAVDALARIGGDAAAVALRDRLAAGDAFIRLAALDGLDRIGAIIPYEELEPLVGDRLLRRVALRALGRTKTRRAVPALREALEDPSPHVVGSAAASLYAICRDVPEAVETLAAEASHVSTGARETLGRLVREGDLPTRRGAALVSLLAQDEANLHEVVALAAQEEVPPTIAHAFRRWGRASVPPLLSVHEESVGVGQAVALELAAELAADDDDSRLHDDVIRSALRRGLRHPESSVCVAAARGLASFATADDAGRLVAAAAAGPEQLARAAGKALRSLRERAPEAVEAVLSKVELDGPGGAALTQLVGEASGERAFTKLSAAISADDPRTRIAAINAFVRIGGSRAAEQVGLALADESVDVQAAAAHALGELRNDAGDPVGIEELLLTLTSTEPTVQAAAARALASTGEERAIEPLRDLLREGRPGVALASMAALRSLSDPSLGDLLVEALGHQDEEVVKEVLAAIAESGGARMASRLAVGLSHPAWDVRRRAAELLGGVGGPAAREALAERQEIEEDDLVSEALSAALEETGPA